MKTAKLTAVFMLAASLMLGCSAQAQSTEENVPAGNTETPVSEVTAEAEEKKTITITQETSEEDVSEYFTDRDMAQTADLSGAVYYTVKDGEDISITEEGVYVLSGTAEDVTVRVETDDSAKVQLVIDELNVTNTDAPVIYVVSADKVFVTTADGTSELSVTGTFADDGSVSTDAVIFSKDDLVLNGTGTLVIDSSDNGITSKDDLKITGGTYVINSSADAIEANDSIRIADGNFTIKTSKDGLHAENDEDDTQGWIYIGGGTFKIEAGSDGIQGTPMVQIDGGTFDISAEEAVEGTYVLINGGDLTIYATDDGINASAKSSAYTPKIEINGGTLDITMAAGDTDALDSNGSIVINGGTVNISAQFAFDFDSGAELNGGTVTVNGTQVTTITESMMGGGMMGGPGNFGGQGGMPEGFGNPGQMPGSDTMTGSTPDPSGQNGQMPNFGGMPGDPGRH
ncbi:MAG: carbohydrate-binding domain-containing protein [Solobacterium sp.]|nr:carbohydrate-binding domain-containing protein [Solobacterium sp.]